MSTTADWQPGPLEDQAGLLGVRVAVWNAAEGIRDAEHIRAGHGAVEVIDGMLRELHALRGQLITEIRANQDAAMARADALLAAREGRQ